jgi:predicted ATPase/class 3 adenylate cyclase
MPAPTGAVTLVFTDIQDSSGLWERLGPAFEPVLAQHHRIVRERLAAHGGYEVKTEGDSFMLAFARPADAVLFAIETQAALHEAPWPPESGELLVRMGVHCGEPICAPDPSGRMDYFGPMVNRAARIASAAHGGQVLVSEAVRGAAASVLETAGVSDLGEHRLRGLERPERLFQVQAKSLEGRVFPPPRTLSALPTNLPASGSSFVGRAREKKEVLDLISEGAGLVTVAGPPGIGKSRLVIEAASAALPHFRGGAWFVEIPEVRDALGIAAAVARAMGISTAGSVDPVAAVGAALELRGPTLLVLDAFEHAVSFAAATVGEWRRRAPQVTCLVASCEILGLPGEREYPLAPLDTAGADPDALRLFLERAREADHRFRLGPDNDADVRAIVVELEGIPLALELAAARLRIMKPAQLRQKLTQKFQLLRSSRTDLPANRRTLEGAVEWSWSLLADWEREAFAQLCVFRGGFFLEAAEAVLDLSAVPDAPMAIDVVQRLREKSFLRTEETPHETRFAMYRTVREFGESKLGDAGAETVRLRLADWCSGCLERLDGELSSPGAAEALDRADLEIPNANESVLRLLRASRWDAAAALLRHFHRLMAFRGRGAALGTALDAALAAVPASAGPARAWVAVASGYIRKGRGDFEGALSLASEAQAIAPVPADDAGSAWALLLRAEIHIHSGRLDDALADLALFQSFPESSRLPHLASQARVLQALVLISRARRQDAITLLREAVAIGRSSGDALVLADSLDQLAPFLFQEGLREEAITSTREVESIARRLGNSSLVSTALSRRGHYLAQYGDLAGALSCLQEAGALLRREGRRDQLAFTLRIHGNLHRRRGEFDDALACYAEAERLERASGRLDSLASVLRGRGHLLIQRGQVDEAEKNYREAADISVRLNDRQGQLASLSDLSNIAQARGDDAALLDIHTRGESLARELGEPGSIATHLRGRAALLISKGKAEDALSLLDEAGRIQQPQPFPVEEGHFLFTRSHALLELRRFAEARDTAQAALACYERGGSPIRAASVSLYAYIFDCESALGRPEAAREAAVQALRIASALGISDGGGTAATQRSIDRVRRLLGEGNATPASGK